MGQDHTLGSLEGLIGAESCDKHLAFFEGRQRPQQV